MATVVNVKSEIPNAVVSRRKPLFLVILLGTTLLFRLPVLLFNDSLRLDEGFSLRFIQPDLTDIITHATRDSHSPFYTLILKGWCALFGTSEIATRSLSVLFGVLAVLSLYQLGRMLYGEKAGFIAAGLAAISPLWTWYSVETRMYTIWLTFICINTIFFFSLLKRPNTLLMIGYALSGSLIIYTQYFGILVLGIHFSLLVFSWKKNGRLIWWLGQAYTLIALTFVPWIVAILIYSEDFPPDKLPPPTFIELYRIIVQLFFGFTTDFPLYRAVEPVLVVATLAFIIITFTVFIPAVLTSNKVKSYTKGFMILPIGVIVTFFVFSFFISVMEVRYLLCLTPFIYLLVGNILTSSGRLLTLRRTIWITLVVGLFGAATVIQTIDTNNQERVDYRGVESYLTAQIKPGDRIVLDAYFIEPAFNYYYDHQAIAPIVYAPTSGEIEQKGQDFVAERLRPPDGTRIVWVVQSYWERPQSPALKYYTDKYQIVDYKVFSPELRLWGFWSPGS